MKYRVVITPEAESDLRAIHYYIRLHAPRAAHAWLSRARSSAKSLSRHPERCPLAPESASFHQPIRELFFGERNRGTYRFLFVILGQDVYILHVRHGSRLPLTPE
jgi:plasmid stabilization system protein ParE